MKKYILFIILYLGLIPYIHNRHIQFWGIQKVFAQDDGDEEDSDGDLYDPINDGPLPPDNATDIQGQSHMCVFEDMALISSYYGLNAGDDQYTFADWYSTNYDVSYNTAVNVDGVEPGDLSSVLSSWFDIAVISDASELADDLSQNNMEMGIWQNSDGSNHAVLIVSLDDDENVEYFDPDDGTYSQTTLDDFDHVIEITPRE